MAYLNEFELMARPLRIGIMSKPQHSDNYDLVIMISTSESDSDFVTYNIIRNTI